MRYNEGGEIIEIIIRDSSGAKIETHKFQANDVKRANYILNSIKRKYGLGESRGDMDWLN
jgi:hypothetical protein